MKKISDTALFVDSKGNVRRVKVPFLVRVKNNNQRNLQDVWVKRIVFEDNTMVLYEIDKDLRPHFDYELITEGFVRYELSTYI